MEKYKLVAEDYVSNKKIVEIIRESIEKNNPLSLVRIGDGENIVMAQEKVLSLEWISKNVPWKNKASYCGTTLPNLKARDKCIRAVKNANLVGVFAGDKLTEKIFRTYNIIPKNTFYAFNNIYLPMYKPFVQLIIDYPPLLVGKPSEKFAHHIFEKLGIRVPWINEINLYNDIDSCIEAMSKIPHRWALVSAGINALIISDEMSRKYGKIVIDFGHAPDNVMSPKFKHYWLTIP